jgi:hypothetical protein
LAPNIQIEIDGTSHATKDSDQEAAALLRLAGRDPKQFDLFLITEHGIEERIRDAQIVNLKNGERFVTREKVHFTIDGESFTTFDDDQEAAALIRLAGLNPAEYDLARITRQHKTFESTEMVRIADGDEFVTAKHVGGVA